MNTNYFRKTVFALVAIFTISCSKDDDSSLSYTNTSESSAISTWAKFTVATPAGLVKPNYIVMMFETPFSPTAPLPTIIKQVTTDANGLASFDLNTIVTTTVAKKYYFEVFTQSGSNFTLKSTYSRFDSDFVKGSHLTTSLLVNN